MRPTLLRETSLDDRTHRIREIRDEVSSLSLRQSAAQFGAEQLRVAAPRLEVGEVLPDDHVVEVGRIGRVRSGMREQEQRVPREQARVLRALLGAGCTRDRLCRVRTVSGNGDRTAVAAAAPREQSEERENPYAFHTTNHLSEWLPDPRFRRPNVCNCDNNVTAAKENSMFDALDTGGVPVSDHEASHPPLGSLLVERGLITDEQLQQALAEHGRTGLPLGQVLISLSYATAATIAQALATQQGGVVRTEFGLSTGFGTPGLLSVPPVSPPAAVSKPLRIAAQEEPTVAEVGPVPAPIVSPSPDPELESARSRIAELELELAAAVSANAGRIEELERALADARAELGRIPALQVDLAAARQAQVERDAHARELELARAELARVTQNFSAAYERLQQYELASAEQLVQQPRTVSPFAWQS